MVSGKKPVSLGFENDGIVANNPKHPVLVYRGAVSLGGAFDPCPEARRKSAAAKKRPRLRIRRPIVAAMAPQTGLETNGQKKSAHLIGPIAGMRAARVLRSGNPYSARAALCPHVQQTVPRSRTLVDEGRRCLGQHVMAGPFPLR